MACIVIKTISQNQNANPKDWEEWETIYSGDISNDGKWVFYVSKTEAGNDTLIVKTIKGDKHYKIPGGSRGSFTNNNKYFSSIDENLKLILIDLKNNKRLEIDSVQTRDFTKDESFLILNKRSQKNTVLNIKNLNNGKFFSTFPIKMYSIHPVNNQIAILSDSNGNSTVNILDLDSNKSTLLKGSNTHDFKNLKWSKDGKHLTFHEIPKEGITDNPKIYSCKGNQCQSLIVSDISNLSSFKMNRGFSEISQIGEFVFFKGIPKNIDTLPNVPTGVQVWSGSDKYIYPQRKMEGLLKKQPFRYLWNTKSNMVHTLSDTTVTEILSVNNDYLLKIDKLVYQPQYKYVGEVDYYLFDLPSGKEKPFLRKQNPEQLFVDPNGRFIVFFRENAWHSYNLATQKFQNLTEKLDVSFFDALSDRSDNRTPYSKRIRWLEEENSILVCDEFDVWKLSLDGKSREKLTKGKEIKTKYRPVIDFGNPKNINQLIVNLNKGLLLRAEDENWNSGYYLLDSKRSLLELAFGSYMADGIKWDVNVKHFLFRLQSYATPPKLLLYDRESKNLKTLVLSNENKKIGEWGKPELFEFTMENGNSSKGFLIYPTNYNPIKKYPMVVCIYENQTRRMHDFYPISDFGTSGFNPTHYALDGYFVLMPDIEYEIGNPGISALNYVEESIDHVIKKVKIDTTKIGLYGFSFGGYESAFIATQTNKFAAIASGAAVTNMVTFYHAVNWGTGREEMWRMEDYQMRMDKPYYERKEDYIKNSPFHSIENLNTPILLWAGAQDYHIDYNESIRFYLALRRLNKKVKLLLFENQGHNILDYKKQEYLSHAIKEWFDKYCK